MVKVRKWYAPDKMRRRTTNWFCGMAMFTTGNLISVVNNAEASFRKNSTVLRKSVPSCEVFANLAMCEWTSREYRARVLGSKEVQGEMFLCPTRPNRLAGSFLAYSYITVLQQRHHPVMSFRVSNTRLVPISGSRLYSDPVPVPGFTTSRAWTDTSIMRLDALFSSPMTSASGCPVELPQTRA